MLRKNNNGSILIMSLIIFSIISLMCITCSALILSNNKISNLEYKNEKLREQNLGLIELIKSNALIELKDIMYASKTEDEFYNILKENEFKNFTNNIKDISDINLKNYYIEITYNNENKISTKKEVHYKVLVRSKIDNYEKNSFIGMKIENPYSDKEKDFQQIDENKEISPSVNNLITFYNYKEE